MAKSLSDQLMKAGLVDKNAAKKAEREKRKQSMHQHKGPTDADLEKQARLQREREAKAERDRDLNRQRQEAEQAREMKAQAAQMLAQNALSLEGDIRFSFTDARINKIKQLYVNQEVQEQLARGRVAICSVDERYLIVAKAVAEKIAQRFSEAVIFLAEPDANEPDEDDPYADFVVPDDLMW